MCAYWRHELKNDLLKVLNELMSIRSLIESANHKLVSDEEQSWMRGRLHCRIDITFLILIISSILNDSMGRYHKTSLDQFYNTSL